MRNVRRGCQQIPKSMSLMAYCLIDFRLMVTLLMCQIMKIIMVMVVRKRRWNLFGSLVGCLFSRETAQEYSVGCIFNSIGFRRDPVDTVAREVRPWGSLRLGSESARVRPHWWSRSGGVVMAMQQKGNERPSRGAWVVATSCDPPVGCRFGATRAPPGILKGQTPEWIRAKLPNDLSGKGFR